MNKLFKIYTLLLCLPMFWLNAYTLQEFLTACDARNSAGCFNLGVLYEGGRSVKQDYFKSTGYYTKACEAGQSTGCFILAVFYETGKGVEKSNSKAKELYGKACDLGENLGCENYAKLNKL